VHGNILLQVREAKIWRVHRVEYQHDSGSLRKDLTSFCIYARGIFHVFQYLDLENGLNTWKFAEQVKCSNAAI
jgi:hypothetical protein